MRSKLIALTLAVALAVSGTGIAAAGSVSPDTADAPTPDDSTDAADDDPADDAENRTFLTTNLTTNESVTMWGGENTTVTMWGGENTTVLSDEVIRITADDSFTLDLSSGEIESAGDDLYVIELPDVTDDGADEANATDG
jgi:hypothetical protein